MTNPGRYLVLYPTGQASPLPDPNNPNNTEGAFPFSANPGDQFKDGIVLLTLILCLIKALLLELRLFIEIQIYHILQEGEE